MRYPKKEKPPKSVWIREIFGAGYGSRTRLLALGNIKAGFTIGSLKRKKCCIYNGFSDFASS